LPRGLICPALSYCFHPLLAFLAGDPPNEKIIPCVQAKNGRVHPWLSDYPFGCRFCSPPPPLIRIPRKDLKGWVWMRCDTLQRSHFPLLRCVGAWCFLAWSREMFAPRHLQFTLFFPNISPPRAFLERRPLATPFLGEELTALPYCDFPPSLFLLLFFLLLRKVTRKCRTKVLFFFGRPNS